MQNHARVRTTTHVRGRPWTHVAAVARNNANYADTARYCVKLQQKSRNTELDLCVRGRAWLQSV